MKKIIGSILACFCCYGTLYTQTQYALPFPSGTSVTCTRSTSHTLPNELNAYDFVSNAATTKYVTAARSGCVRRIKQNGNTCGCDISYANDANYVVIDHADGTEALYLHLQYNSVVVTTGQTVSAGDTLGIMGATGFTCGSAPGGCAPHLHFQVQTAAPAGCGDVNATWYSTSLPISFCNVNENGGMPVGGNSYSAQGCGVQLLSPVSDAQVNATNISFSWNALFNATAYRIQISTTSTFATTVVNENVGNVTSKIFTLLPNTEYFWRVKSNLTAEFTSADEVRRLLAIPAAPQLIYPTSGATNIPTTVNFDWNDTQGALNYRIQVSEDPALLFEQFNGPYVLNFPVSGNLTQSSYSWNGAQPNKNYYWRVRVNTAKGTSLFAARSFSTAATAGGGATSATLNYRFDDLPLQSLPAVNGSDVFLPVQSLQPGYHTADFYFSSTTGSRSSITRSSFVKALGNSAVNTMEYWFDTNFIARQTMQFSNAAGIDLNVPANNLSTGYHILYYRFQLQGGLWSSVNASTFLKNTASAATEKEMEYWYDNMFANRQTVTLTDPSNIDFNLSTNELALGPHTVYYRFRTGTEDWSSVAASSFIKNTTASGAAVMEYWFNSGFDDRIAATVSDLNNVDVQVNTNGLPAGNNILYSRFQKGNGYWSSVTATAFLKSETSNTGWQYQYWIDSTMGLAVTLPIADPNTIDLDADVSIADTGWHILYSRFRHNSGLWSSVTADSFYKSTATYQCIITNSPGGEDSIATHFLCKHGIIDDPQDGIFNLNKILRADLAKITYRGLIGTAQPEPVTLANYLPSLFGDLQKVNASNSYYFNAAKFLSYIDYGDGITPFNPSRLNFHPNDTIVRGYALKVLLEAWNIKPDASLPPVYNDLVPGAEVNGYILKAAQMGIVKQGAGFLNFRPYEAVTRVEAFLMLYRLLQICSKPEITDADFHIPFNRDSIVGNNPSLGEGNFSSYGETPFTIKGVPSLSFSFNYNAAATEMPDEAVRGNDANGRLVYNQQTIGVGWNHNYNNYILVDTGISASSADDRFVIMWSGGNVQLYDPNTGAYTTKGVYDQLTNNGLNPSFITIKTKNQVIYRFEKLLGVTAGILHLVSVTDRHGNTVSLTYENGFSETPGIVIKRLKEVNDSHSRKIEFVYLDNTNLIDSVSANAGSLHKAVSFDYVAGRLVKYTNPKKDVTIYNYSTLPGQQYMISKIVMPNGNIITNKYSGSNKLTSTDLNGAQQTLIQTNPVYTAGTSTTDITIKTIANGVMLQQNVRNNQYSMPIAASGPNYKTGVEYADAANPLLPTKINDSLTGVQVTPVYSSNGNLLTITKSAPGISITESMLYNSYNDVIEKTDGNNNTTQFTYNMPQGQLIAINAPNGITTHIFPHTNGTVDSIVNPSGIATKFSYDSYGNLTQTKLPLNIVSSAENDAFGRVLKSINPKNTGTQYLYDANDNMLQEGFDTTGLNIVTQYRFDKNNNLIEVENARGNITYLTYNSNDQLVKEMFGTAVKQYEYGSDGRLKKFTSPNGTSFTNLFNEKDLLTSDGYATYTYYPDNSLQTVSRNGKTITYNYDGLKRITAVSYNDFAGNTTAYQYDNNNNITKITYPGGFAVNYEYDANNRLTVVKDNSNNPWATYDYLADGRLNTQTNRNGTVVKYFYDAAGRMDSMVTVKSDGSTIAAYGFELDVLGNHTTENFIQPFMQTPPALGDSIAYTYSNTNRLLTKNTDSYSYDNNGNLTGIAKNSGAVNYSYDPKNNLLQYTGGGNTITYEYDGLGQRRKRNSTRYVLDNAYNVLVETDAAGSPQYYYIQGLGMIARVKVSTGQPYYYHHDFRGSTVAITNSSQVITHKYQYGAFGETQQVQEEDYNAYRYVGKYGVGYETKDLTFMRARYYQPGTGRFNSEDPVWATNLYPYGENNPTKNIDPKGTYIKEPNMNSENTFSYYENIDALERERNKAWKELYSLVKDANRSQGTDEQKAQRKRDLVFAKQRYRNINILKHSYEAYLKSVEVGKPDETLNPFGNTLFYMDRFGVSKIMELKNGNFVVTLLAGSMVSPSGNSRWLVTSDQIINKINSTVEKNPNDKVQEKAYEYLNNLLNGILLNGKSFYE